MPEKAQIHYLEVVTPNVEQICESFSQTLGVSFGEVISELGNAQIAPLSNGAT